MKKILRFVGGVIVLASLLAAHRPTTRSTTQPESLLQIPNPDYDNDEPGLISSTPGLPPPRDRLPAVVQYPPEDAANVVEQASCVVQVEAAQNGDFRSDGPTIAAILSSSGVEDSAIKQSLALSVEQRAKLVRIAAYPTNEKCALLVVVLRRGEIQFPANAADKLIHAMIDSLRASVQQTVEVQIKAINDQIDQAKAKQSELNKHLEALRDKLQEDRGKLGELAFGNYTLNSIVAELRTQKRNVEQELNRMKDQLASYGPVPAWPSEQWQAVVDLRQKQLDELKQSGKASASEISDQEEKLAEAKAQLLTAKQAEAAAGNASDLRYRMDQVRGFKQQIAEEEKVLAPIDEQLNKLQDPAFIKMLDEMPELQDEIQRTKNQISQLNNRIDWARQRIPDSPPLVIIIAPPTTQP
ncbi:MAG TPA: hypothetical protein VGF52_00190 [Tepidisphaeraceae bacterium]